MKLFLAVVLALSVSAPLSAAELPDFADDFQSNNNKWYSMGDTQVKNGEYYVYNKDISQSITWNRLVFSEGRIEVDMKFRGGAHESTYGLMFKYRDNSHTYMVLFNRAAKCALILVNGDIKNLTGWKSVKAHPSTFNRVVVDVEDNLITVTVNGQQAFQVTDRTIRSGKIGFYARKETSASFDNLKVWLKKDGQTGSVEKSAPAQTMKAVAAGRTLVSGMVTESGKPVPGIEVKAYLISDLKARRVVYDRGVVTDGSGKFALDLAQGSQYMIKAGVDERDWRAGRGKHGGTVIDLNFPEEAKNVVIPLERS